MFHINTIEHSVYQFETVLLIDTFRLTYKRLQSYAIHHQHEKGVLFYIYIYIYIYIYTVPW